MPRWVMVGDVAVRGTRNDLAIAHDDGADGYLSALLRLESKLQSGAHKILVGHQTLRSAGEVFFCFAALATSGPAPFTLITTTV